MDYRPNYSLIVVGAICLNLGLWWGFGCLLPKSHDYSPTIEAALVVDDAEAMDQANIPADEGTSLGEVPPSTSPSTARNALQKLLLPPVNQSPLPPTNNMLPQEKPASASPDLSKPQKKPVERTLVAATPKEHESKAPVVATKVKKAYQPVAGGLSYRGRVNFLATIGTDGRVKSLTPVASSGKLMIDALAKEYALKWEFIPAKDNKGQPIEQGCLISIAFE